MTEPTYQDLKACPFCGGDKLNIFYQTKSSTGETKERVQCVPCGVEVDLWTWNPRPYEAEIQALKAENAELRARIPNWVPIGNIPAEWKDGRDLDAFHTMLGIIANCEPEVVEMMKGITHVKLPQTPPQRSNHD